MPAVISAGYATMLASRSLTLCWILKITRQDGIVLAYTDHDSQLTVDGQLYKPVGGITGGDVTQKILTSPDTVALTALLSSVGGHINRSDVLQGLYDRADVQIGLADWATPANGARYLGPMIIAEAEVLEGAVRLSVNGLDVLLKADGVRTITPNCQVRRFGNSECDPDGTILAANQETLTVTAVSTDASGQQVITFGTAPRLPGFFAGGIVKFTSGLNNGLERMVKAHPATLGSVLTQICAAASGGSPYTSDSGVVSGTDAAIYTNAGATIDRSNVTNPAPTTVYKNLRYGLDWKWTLTGYSANAPLSIRLHFCEIFYGATLPGGGGIGSRVFDVIVNGVTVFPWLDITSEAGGPLIAMTKSVSTNADGAGKVTITFTRRTVGSPAVCAVEAFPITNTTTPLTMRSPFPYTVSVGDTALLTYGCDGTFGACQAVGNSLNFRALGKDMPGPDAASSVGRG